MAVAEADVLVNELAERLMKVETLAYTLTN